MTTYPRESVIERKVCDKATADGWYVRKYTTPARRSAPDRIFIKAGRVVFIEFKRDEDIGPTPAQARELQALREAGVEAYCCGSVGSALTVLGID